MSLFTPILRLFNVGGISNPDTGYQNAAGTGGISTSSGSSVTDERALKISAVWSCVQLISNSVASLPLGFYTKTTTGRDELERDPLIDLFHKRPNQVMKPRDFRLAMTVQMALWNNAYSEIVWSGTRPVALMPLRPGRMTPYINDDGTLTYHYSTPEGVKIYAKKDILHLKGFGTDGVVGADRSSYARESYGLTVAAEDFAAKQFANGGRPGGVISFSEFLKPEQRAQAKELYEGLAEGAINSNKLWVLEGGSDYKALDFAADQMQMIGTRSQQLSEVARFFGVPDVMIGAGSSGSSAWPASFEQQMLSFLNFTIQPYLDEWECGIRDALIPGSSSNFADHDVSNFIKMDSNSKANYLSKLTQNGLMTRNEGRKSLNLPQVDGADELTVQTNLSNLEDLEVINDVSQTDQPTGELPTQVQQ